MTDSLVTRLRALAVKMKDRSRHITYDDVDEGADALREAADALGESCSSGCVLLPQLERAEAERDDLKAENASAWKAGLQQEKEIAGLKAKLAEAETELKFEMEVSSALGKERGEARAEAAALREAGNALVPFLPDISYGIAAKHSSHQQAVMAFKAALSQPCPGAAYQERTRKLEAVVTQLATLDCRDNSCYFVERPTGMRTNGGCQCFRDSSPRGPKQAFLAIKALALAALEEKP